VKVKLLLVACCAFFVLAGSAQAFQWHMSYGQAKNASKEFVKGVCAQENECTSWGAGQCYRRSQSRFDCEVGTFYKNSPNIGEETECTIALHWGASQSGYVVLKNHGPVHCFRV
jgi:hypothetical protein